jgi:L-asparagine transporter-like permease
MALLTAVKGARVGMFGEFEFWLAAVKVTAICAFIAIGLIAIAGLLPGVRAPGTSNLLGRGGFAPHGPTAVLTATLTVIFSYFGTEVVAIAAGESDDPAATVRRGTTGVVWRILVFYLGSIAVIVTLLPADAAGTSTGPYVAVMQRLHVPATAGLMDAVVITAVLSCLNSGIYSSSRMLYALAVRREAPVALARTDRRGVPANAVLAASAGGFGTVVADYFLPTDAVFDFLLDSPGAIAVAVYLSIAATQLHSRARLGSPSTVRMWAHPYLAWLVVAALVAVMRGMVAHPDTRRPFVLTAATALAVTAGVGLQLRAKRAEVQRELSRFSRKEAT